MNLAATLGLNPSNFLAGIAMADGATAGFKARLTAAVAPAAMLSAAFLAVGTSAKLMTSAVGQASKMEDFKSSFQTLLGSAEAAEARMRVITELADRTPFDLNGLSAASRVLQAFTGEALATGQGLRMVGDAAAAIGQPLEAVSIWMGRLFASLRDGDGLMGEPIQNLTQLGLISGATRKALMDLQGQAQGVSGAMAAMEQAFGKNSGAMERMAVTLSGRMSTLKDSFAAFGREIGGPILPIASENVRQMSGLINELAGNLRMVKAYWADAFGIVNTQAGSGLEQVAGLLARARALETVGEKQALLLELEEKLLALRQRADESPALDFSQALAQVEAMVSYLKKLPDSILKPDPVNKDTEDKKEAEDPSKVIESARLQMADLADRQVMGNSGADILDREIAAIQIAQRKTSGVLVTPPQNLEQAREQLELELQLVEQMRLHPNLIELAASKSKLIVDAYREVLELQSNINGQKTKIEGVEKPSGVIGFSGFNRGDRLAQIGGFIGGAGGPALDYARRSAVASENVAKEVAALNRKVERLQPAEGAIWK